MRHPPANDLRKAEFIALFRRSGWSQAELARKLEMTRGGVNGVITGRTSPSAMALRLFRLILVGECPEALAAAPAPVLEPWEEQVLGTLRGLNPAERVRLLGVIDAFTGPAAVPVGRNAAGGPRRKGDRGIPKAVASTGKTSGRERGAAGRFF